jgi:hypothetical protein
LATRYRIYGNDGLGGPVDESTPLVTGLAVLTWDTPALGAPSHNKYIVRAYDTVSGLEEKNVDSLLEIVIDAAGEDVTGRPVPPEGLLASPIADADLRVEWTHPQIHPTGLPTGFRVYKGTGGTPDYNTVAATVAYLGHVAHRTTLTGLTPGTEYAIGVRAYNASGEEENDVVVLATPSDTAPSNVTGLASSLVN